MDWEYIKVLIAIILGVICAGIISLLLERFINYKGDTDEYKK